MTTKVLAAILAAAAVAPLVAAPAHANPPAPGCVHVLALGLTPGVTQFCDTPIQPDGSWIRFRSFSHQEFVRSTCGEFGVMTRTGYWCPDWAPRDAVSAYQSPVDQCVVFPDAIPPGEPGHIDS